MAAQSRMSARTFTPLAGPLPASDNRRVALVQKPGASQPRHEGELVGGKYKLEKQLGEGGMGVVFAARHMGTRRRVAVKCIASHANSITANARFLREAQVAGRIEHPNVVQVLDVGEDPRGRYIVMECLQGETLADVLQRRKLAPADAIDVLIPALRGVHAAHKRGIVHRDLKPENIFVCRPDVGPVQIKVLDFGISKLLEDDGGEDLTRTGTLLGTPQYMSPDRVRGQGHADKRNDIYAMGVILYEAITGARPFDGVDLNEVMKRIARQNVPAITEIDPLLPAGLAAVVRKAMAPNADERYQDVESFARALEPYAGVERFAPQVRDPTETMEEEATKVLSSAAAMPVEVATPPAPPRPARAPASEAAAVRPPPPPEAALARAPHGQAQRSQAVVVGRPEGKDEDSPFEELPTRPPLGSEARRLENAAALESLCAIAAVQARPIRELIFQLSLGRTLRGWASACRAPVAALLEGAKRSELKELVASLEQFDAALKRAAGASSSAIDAETAAALQAGYRQLTSQLTDAFPPDSATDARRRGLLEAVLLRVPGMQKRTLGKLAAGGVHTLEQLCKAPPEEISAQAAIERELAQALVRRAQQFERERQYQDPADREAQIERRLRALSQRLEVLRVEFERAEREEALERKRAARQGRENSLLELNQLLAELGEAELADELQRYPISGKIQGIERYLKRQGPAAE